MELHIIGGAFRGTKLFFPDNVSSFRPTKNRVREAVVNALVMDIPDAKVLELCAGSMIMSLELLSRGATKAVAVEHNRAQCSHLQKQLKNRDLLSRLQIENCAVESYLNSCSVSFDIIFFDPPYYDDSLSDCLGRVVELLNSFGVLVFESATDDAYAHKQVRELQGVSVKEKKYGNSYIHTIRKE